MWSGATRSNLALIYGNGLSACRSLAGTTGSSLARFTFRTGPVYERHFFHWWRFNVKFSRSWAMPNADTFDCKPMGDFVRRYLQGVSVDPFARNKR